MATAWAVPNFSPARPPLRDSRKGRDMKNATRRTMLALGATASSAALLTSTATIASASGGDSSLPPTWHIHNCTATPCMLPSAPVGFFPVILGETTPTYLNDPAECPDATDKAFLGGGQPPTTDGTEQNQPLREGVCMTSTTIIHLRSVSPDQPAPTGWTLQGVAGGFATYYLLTPAG